MGTDDVISAMVAARGDGKAASAAFAGEGFGVGTLVGGTFAITAPRATFERVFGVRLDESTARGVTVVGGAADPHALPLSGLSACLRDGVDIVTFSAPPAFGPGNP